jgi:glycosyltransferase involved in cell wall biosynthesis
MRISVVIPTKNRSHDVERLLNCLLQQAREPDEVIVADDSRDLGTKRIVEKFENVYTKRNIELRHIWDSGSLSRARLLGGLKSKGDIIIYVDDDLVIRKDSLKILVETLLKKETLAVWAKISFRDSHSFRLKRIFDLLYYHSLFGGSELAGGFFAIRRKVLEDKVWFDQNLSGYALGEDQDFAYSVHRHYGLENISQVKNPVLAVNNGLLIKDKKYYKQLFGNTIYFAKKRGEPIRLISAFLVTMLLCSFNVISEGGRGTSSISKKEILSSYFDTLKNFKLILTGNLDAAYE